MSSESYDEGLPVRHSQFLALLSILLFVAALAACSFAAWPVEVRNYTSQKVKVQAFRADGQRVVSLEIDAGKAVRLSRDAARKAGLGMFFFEGGNYVVVTDSQGKGLLRRSVSQIAPDYSTVETIRSRGAYTFAVTESEFYWLYEPKRQRLKE